MDRLIKLAAWALIECARAANSRTTILRLTTAAACTGLAAVLMVAALGCAAAALWIFTLPALGPVGAPLIVAATLSTATLGLAIAAWLILRRNRHPPGGATAPGSLLSEPLLSGAMRLFNDHKGALLLAAVVAGMTAANGGPNRGQGRE